MNALTLARILAVCLLINEAVVVFRTPPDEREQIVLPPLPWLMALLLLPFFFAIKLPGWLAVIAVALQAFGLFMEVVSEIQLTRAKSFGVLSEKATQPQTTGFYQWFEHPIYVGILLQMIGWSIFMPLAFVAVGVCFIAVRKMVQNERTFLAKTLNFSHKGLDTALWS